MKHDVVEIRGSLLFDSWFEDSPLVRDASPEDRHLIYEGGGVILDLLVKKASDTPCLHVGGQVLPDGDSARNVANLPVVIHQGAEESRTRTNPIGEFMFHAVPGGNFDLSISLRGCRFVVRGLGSNDPRAWRLAYSVDSKG